MVIDGQRLTAKRTGVGRCLEALLAGWAEIGLPLNDTLLVLRDSTILDQVPEIAGLKTVVVGEHWPGLAWEIFGLARLLGPDDLLFAPANVVPPFWFGPNVLMIFDTLTWSVPRSFSWHVKVRFGWRYRMAARRADRVIVPSQATAADVARVHRVEANRLAVVFPGPEPGFQPRSKDDPEVLNARQIVGLGSARFFLFVGKRSRRRNVPAILEAFRRHLVSFPDDRLVFVGPTGGDDLPGPEFGVIDAGHVDERTLQGLYSDAQALLYPSDHEGFGLPVVEAQASGCPVVTLRNSALVESAGEAAWYLDAATPEAIESALRVLAEDGRIRDDYRSRGLANVARFSREAFARGVKDEILKVVRASGGRSVNV